MKRNLIKGLCVISMSIVLTVPFVGCSLADFFGSSDTTKPTNTTVATSTVSATNTPVSTASATSTEATITATTTAKTTGVATITAISAADSSKTATCNVTVNFASIKGIDVSHWQGAINWQSAKSDGVQFAMIAS